MIVDMTKGSPMKVILRFAIPMFISVLFQQLYSLVDSVIAGQYVGLNALAAVSVSYPIISLLTAVANGINVGCSVVVSQIFGAKKEKELKSAIFTSMITIFLTGIILTALGLAICEPVMRLLQTPADIFEDSVLYLQIYIAGFAFLYLYNGANAIYTALGDSRTPLYFLIFSSLFNIVLDLLFVVAFQMGVAGLALATDLAMGVSAALALFFLNRKLKGYLVEDRVKFFDKRMFREIVIISVPSILQASSVSLGNLLVQGLINSYGSLVVAGSSAGAKLNILLLSCMSAMGNTLASYSAQNMGAHSVDRMKRGLIEAAKITMIMMSVFMLVTFVFAEQCIGCLLYTSKWPQRKGPSNCLAKTQVYAKPKGEVYELTPARCWKVKGSA